MLLLSLSSATALVLISACSEIRVSSSDGVYREPRVGGEYLIARPTNYDRKSQWPLFVLCHSGFPDSAKRQVMEWTKLADEKGFIVVAPVLDQPRRILGREEEEARDEQLSSTRLIINIVEHVRAAHNISEDRVLLYGYGRGAEPALHAALLHPEIFRAVSVSQPILENDRLPGMWTQVDPRQAVYVRYNTTDRLRHERYRELSKWLVSIGANVQADTAGAADRDRPERAVTFFELLLRKEPWLSVRAFKPDLRQPLTVQLKLRGSLDAKQVRWDFGDGTYASEAEPLHTYAEPGVYEIKVAVTGADGKEASRALWLTMPDAAVFLRPPRK